MNFKITVSDNTDSEFFLNTIEKVLALDDIDNIFLDENRDLARTLISIGCACLAAGNGNQPVVFQSISKNELKKKINMKPRYEGY